MNVNIYYVFLRFIDSIFACIWKVAEFIIVCSCPMMHLHHYSEAVEIEFLEIRGTATPITVSDLIYEEIDSLDYSFHHLDTIPHAYYIGSYVYLPERIVLGSVISPNTFYRYSYPSLHHYLVGYHVSPSPEHAVHVLQLVGEPSEPISLDQVYFYSLPVVVKTYWIRLIQRTWKRVYRERMQVVSIRKSCNALRIWQETGYFPAGARNLPGIRGIMCVYSK